MLSLSSDGLHKWMSICTENVLCSAFRRSSQKFKCRKKWIWPIWVCEVKRSRSFPSVTKLNTQQQNGYLIFDCVYDTARTHMILPRQRDKLIAVEFCAETNIPVSSSITHEYGIMKTCSKRVCNTQHTDINSAFSCTPSSFRALTHAHTLYWIKQAIYWNCASQIE